LHDADAHRQTRDRGEKQHRFKLKSGVSKTIDKHIDIQVSETLIHPRKSPSYDSVELLLQWVNEYNVGDHENKCHEFLTAYDFRDLDLVMKLALEFRFTDVAQKPTTWIEAQRKFGLLEQLVFCPSPKSVD